MRNLDSGMRLGKSLGIGAGLTLATFTSAFLLDRTFPTGNLANWVQGIGSIFAIIGVVWVTSAQTRASIDSVRKNLEWSAEMQQRAAMAVVEACKQRVDQVIAAIESDSDWNYELAKVYARPILDGLSGALSAFPAHQLPTHGAVAAFLLLQQHLVFFADNTDALNAGPWNHPLQKPLLEQLRASYEVSKSEAEREVMLRTVRAGVEGLKTNMRTQAKQIEKQVEVLCKGLGL